MNFGMVAGSLVGGLICELLKENKKRGTWLLFNLGLNAIFNILLFTLPYEGKHEVTATMYFMMGMFFFSSYTIFFIIVLDLGKQKESEKEGKVIGTWLGLVYGFMLLGKATSEVISQDYSNETVIYAACSSGIVALVFALIAAVLMMKEE